MSNKESASKKQMEGDIRSEAIGKIEGGVMSKIPDDLKNNVMSSASSKIMENMVGSLDTLYGSLNSELYTLNQRIPREGFKDYIINPMPNYIGDLNKTIGNIQASIDDWQIELGKINNLVEEYTIELLPTSDSEILEIKSIERNSNGVSEQLEILINKLNNMENNQHKIYELINEYIELDSETNEKLNKLLLDIKENTSEDKIVGKIKSETESLVISKGVDIGLAFIFKAIFSI